MPQTTDVKFICWSCMKETTPNPNLFLTAQTTSSIIHYCFVDCCKDLTVGRQLGEDSIPELPLSAFNKAVNLTAVDATAPHGYPQKLSTRANQ